MKWNLRKSMAAAEQCPHHLRGALDKLLLDEAVNIQIILENAGSALGAALAAAMTEQN